MSKLVKPLLQTIFIMSPILYWNFNVDRLTNTFGIVSILGGVLLALLTEWLYKFIIYLKS